MSFWVTAYCHDDASSVTPKDLMLGVSQRLAVLAAHFPGDRPEEETPEAIDALLRGLKFGPRYKGLRFGSLIYGGDDFPPITLGRLTGRDDVQGVIADEVLTGALGRLRRPAAKRVRELLSGAVDTVSFSLKTSHYTGIGFPLTIAAAATLVGRAGGVILSGSWSWMAPDGDDVDVILEYDG
jgi:hypothetical protein